MSKFCNTTAGFWFDTGRNGPEVEVDVEDNGTVCFSVDGGHERVWFDVEDWDEFAAKVEEARQRVKK